MKLKCQVFSVMLFTLLFCFPLISKAAVLVQWPNSWSGTAASPLSPTTIGTGIDNAIANTYLSRVGLTAVSSGSRYNSSNWGSTTRYLEIKVTAASGYVINLNSQTFSISMGSSGTGPNGFRLFSSIDNYATSIGTLNTSCSGSTANNITLPSSGYNGLTTITFRIVWNSGAGCSSTFGSGGTGGPSLLTLNGATCAAAPTATAAQTFCSGSTVANLVATGTAIKWYTAASGGTALSTGTVLTATTYYATQTLNSCESVTRRAVTVTLDALPSISVQPSTTAQTYLAGASITSLSVSASGAGITYQWFSNTTATTSGGTNLGSANGAQTNTYTPQNVNAGLLYYYVVVSGTCTPAATSNISGGITVLTPYYLTSTDATLIGNWNTLSGGGGSTLPTFNTSYASLIVDNETAATITSAISLPATSNITVSQGSTAKLTIDNTTVTATINVGSAGILELLADDSQLANLSLGTLATGSEVGYTKTSAQNIKAATYSKLTLGGSAIKSLVSNITIQGELTLPTGNSLALGANTLTLNGTLTGDGLITGSATANLNFGGTGPLGTITMDESTPGITNTVNNFTLNRTSNGLVNLGSNLVIGGAITLTNGIVNINGNTLTLNGTATGTGTLRGSTASNLVIGGSGALGTIYMDATTPGTTNTLQNFTFNRISTGTITLGNTFNVYGIVTPTAGTLASGANNLHLKATGATSYAQVATGAGTISGTMTAEYMVTGGGAGYRPICSPLGGATLAQLSDDYNLDFGSTGPAAANTYYFDESGAPYWNIASGTSASMDSRVYSIYMGGSASWANPLPITMDITGTYAGTSDYSPASLTRSGSIADTMGWHYIRNPWPSGFLWDGTTTTVTGIADIQGQQVWAFNQIDSTYIVYDNSGTGGVIPPFTPLVVQAASNGINITLKNSARYTDSLKNFFDKTGMENYLELTVTDPAGKTDVAKWFTLPEASDGYDKFDGNKRMNIGAPNLYFMLEGNKANKEVWKNIPGATTPIFLNLQGREQGTYTLQIAKDNFAPGVEAFLTDLKTQKVTKVDGKPYAFAYTPGEAAGRFTLHFSGGISSVNEQAETENIVKVGSNGKEVIVIVNRTGNFNVTVYDVLGRPMHTAHNIEGNAMPNTLSLSGLAAGYYLVNVTGEGVNQTKKVHIQ